MMNVDRIQLQFNRRDLLTGAARYAALGLIGAVGSLIVAKRRRLVSQGLCINDGACAQCAVLAQCGLPAASGLREQKRWMNEIIAI